MHRLRYRRRIARTLNQARNFRHWAVREARWLIRDFRDMRDEFHRICRSPAPPRPEPPLPPPPYTSGSEWIGRATPLRRQRGQ